MTQVKIRLLSLVVVLATGLMVYFMLSRAPLRVHVATASAWIPSLVLLEVLTWTHRLTHSWKWLLVTSSLLVAGALTAYSTALVVVQATCSFQLWTAYTGLLLVAFGVVKTLTRVSESFLRRMLSVRST